MGYCGINCSECPVLILTHKGQVSEEDWIKFGQKANPEDIHCDGCMSISGQLWRYCATCEIRKCGIENNVENCAFCPEYSCQKLSKFFFNFVNNPMAIEAKETLKRIKHEQDSF